MSDPELTPEPPLTLDEQVGALGLQVEANRVDIRGIRRSNYVLYVLVVAVAALIALNLSGKVDANRTALDRAHDAIKQSQTAIALVSSDQQAVAALVAAQQASAKASCRIQARGLQANRQLVGVIEGLHAILTLSPTAASRKAQAATPRRTLFHELTIIASLNHHLQAYDKLERKQPATRKC